jgi:hypothetical protein
MFSWKILSMTIGRLQNTVYVASLAKRANLAIQLSWLALSTETAKFFLLLK